MSYARRFPSHWKPFTVRIADVSTQDNEWVHPNIRGKLKAVSSVLKGAITGADSTITVEIGGVAVTGASLTIAYDGSAAGDIDTAFPTALNSFTEDQGLNVKTNGSSSTAMPITVTLWVEPT